MRLAVCIHLKVTTPRASVGWGFWVFGLIYVCLVVWIFFYFKVVLCINISGNFYELLHFSIHLISMAENSS